MAEKLLIIGGAGAFGSFYAKQFSKAGFEVAISDTNVPLGKRLCKREGFRWFGGKNFKEFEMVVVSTPNYAAPKILRKIAPKMKSGALLFDFCSVKTPVEKELRALSESNRYIELASIHPMHGPRVQSISGYPVACIAVKGGKKLGQIKKFFAKSGAKFFYTTSREHDEVISVVLGLVHYSQFVSAGVINDLGIEFKKTLKFRSPNYSLFLGLMARVVLQNPELYAQIQLSNPYNKKMRVFFTKNAKKFEKICALSDAKKLENGVTSNLKSLKGLAHFLAESDRAVESMK